MRFSAPTVGDPGTSVRRVRVVGRVVHLVWGDDLDDALRPVLGVTLVSTAAGSATWSFMAIWAIEELDAKAELSRSRSSPVPSSPCSAASSVGTCPTASGDAG